MLWQNLYGKLLFEIQINHTVSSQVPYSPLWYRISLHFKKMFGNIANELISAYAHSISFLLSALFSIQSVLSTHTVIAPSFSPAFLPPTSAIQSIKAAIRVQWVKEFCEDWCCFGLSFSPQSIDKDNIAQSHIDSLLLRFRKLVYCK